MSEPTATTRQLEPVADPMGNWVRAIDVFSVRTPTLPPATHTNTYIVGEGALVVVDPASPYPEERAALRDAILARTARGETVAAIFLTHQHLDHVSGAVSLQHAIQAPILAHRETASRLLGRIAVDRTVEPGEALPCGGIAVRTVFTPGHAPGHLCLLAEDSRALICGDMVASVGTILIDADDDGDMAMYLASLAAMRTLNASCLLPAHGPPIWNADEHLAYYIAHRLRREAAVLSALNATPQTLDELVLAAYADTSPSLHVIAKRSLRAHLDKLVAEQRARGDGQRWTIAPTGIA